MSVISQKICLIGDFSVGKTSLIRRFVDRQFSDRYLSTVGVKISRKIVNVELKERADLVQLQLLIWDIEGNTKFKKIVPSYLQGAKAAIIVADVTRKETIANLEKHIELFLSINPQKTNIIIAFNKSDLIETDTLITILEKNKFASEERIVSSYGTSAKTGENVDRMFEELAKCIITEK